MSNPLPNPVTWLLAPCTALVLACSPSVPDEWQALVPEEGLDELSVEEGSPFAAGGLNLTSDRRSPPRTNARSTRSATVRTSSETAASDGAPSGQKRASRPSRSIPKTPSSATVWGCGMSLNELPTL